MALVVSLEHGLRQGQTSYPHIVLQLPKEAPCEVTLNLEAEELELARRRRHALLRHGLGLLRRQQPRGGGVVGRHGRRAGHLQVLATTARGRE